MFGRDKAKNVVDQRTSIVVLQPVVPHYRVPLFDAIAKHIVGRFKVHASPTALGHPNSSDREGEHYKLDLRIIPLFGGQLFWQQGAFSVLKGLSRGDRLVVSGDPRLISNVPLLLLARQRGIHTTWWGQGFTPGGRHHTKFRQMLMNLADSVLLYTDREVDRYREMGYGHAALHGLNNALDQTAIQNARRLWPESRLAIFRQEFGLDPQHTFLTVGRITRKMNIDLAIRALTDPTLHNDKLVVIGEGPCREAAERLAESLGVSDRVLWVGALYDEEQLCPYFLSACAFLYPGSIGLSVLHAFGYGLPVVTNNDESEQMPEFAAIIDRHNGVLFDPGSVTETVSAMQEAREKASFLGLNAEEAVLKTWTMEHASQRFMTAVGIIRLP